MASTIRMMPTALGTMSTTATVVAVDIMALTMTGVTMGIMGTKGKMITVHQAAGTPGGTSGRGPQQMDTSLRAPMEIKAVTVLLRMATAFRTIRTGVTLGSGVVSHPSVAIAISASRPA